MAVSALPSMAQSLSVNFGAERGPSPVSEASKTSGVILIDGDKWNNTTVNGSGGLTNLIDSTGATTDATVDWTAQNTWVSGSSGATTTSENGDLTKGYLDDSGTGWTVDLVSQYLVSDLYIIHGTDQGNSANMSVVSVNGQFYKGNGSTTVPATGVSDSWSADNWSVADILLESDNYLKVSKQTAASIAGFSSSPGRSAIAAIQVQNTYSGTLSHWDLNGSTAGAGGIAPSGTWDSTTTNWSPSADGDVATGAWTAGNGAVFSAGTDATDPYAITVSGAQSASALWFQDGTTTIGGDSVTLTNEAVVRTDSNAVINSVISGTDGLLKVGTGTLTLGAQNTFSGGLLIEDGEVTLTTGGSTGAIRGDVTVNPGGTLHAAVNNGLGWGSGTKVNTLNLNGGTFHTSINSDNGWGITVNMTGGSVTNANSGYMSLGGGSSLNSLASDITSTFGANIRIREGNTNNALNIDVADGGAATDMLISGIISQQGGARSLIKNGDGLLALSSQNTYSGGTIVNAGTLALTGGGGGNGTIRGSVTINTGASLSLNTGDATGYNTGTDQLNEINLNGGNLHVAVTNNQTLGNGVISMTGGTITGVAGSNLDFFQGSSALNSLASATTSTVSGPSLSIRQAGGLTITTADGAADIDLDITSVIAQKNAGEPLTKAGPGTLRLGGNNTYTGPTNINAGELSVTGALGVTAVTVGTGATLSGNGTIGGSVNFDTASKLDVSAGVLTVTGNVTFDGFGFDDVIGFDPYTSPNGTYVLIEGTNFDFTNVANFGEANALDLGSGRSAWFTEGSFAAVVVPEPGSAALLLFSSLTLLRRRRA